VLICDLSLLHKYGKLALDSELKSLGFNWQEMVVMMVLERMPGADQTLLSKLLQTDKGNVTRLLNQMEGKGLLMRQITKEDSRRKAIHLTAQGEAHLLPLHQAMSNWEAACLRGLSREQVLKFEETSALIISNILENTNSVQSFPCTAEERTVL
jgi:DNA-binding MarR family transcriptional regulator